MIRAAGGVVYRFSPEGDPEVMVVHRPRYDDWSLPKGKSDPGESLQATALREVWEETGHRCRVIAWLGQHEYMSLDGWKRSRLLRHDRLAPTPGSNPASEVDEIRWIPIFGHPHALLPMLLIARLGPKYADYARTWSATRTLYRRAPRRGG